MSAKRLALHDCHVRLGANFMEFSGRIIPAAYAPLEAEGAAFEESAALMDMSYWSRIRFGGPDRKKFLQGLLTNDIVKLASGGGCRSCILTPKGKLLADFEIYDMDEELLAIGLPRAMENLKSEISKKIILSETVMKDISESSGLFCLAGPQAPEIIGDLPRDARILPRRTGIAPNGYWLVCQSTDPESLWKQLLEAGESRNMRPVGFNALNVVRIRAGIPFFGIDTNEDTIPLEAGLEEAISFAKGCYMGQETIARIQSRGHINKKLVRLRIGGSDVPSQGSPVLMGEREAGTVTSAAPSPPENSVFALAMLQVEAARPEARLQILLDHRAVPAAVF